MTIMITLIVAATLIIIMTTALNAMSMKKTNDREKSSPFECGFDPKSSARLPFSLHFFLIALIFLIFDVEIAILFPISVSMKMIEPIKYSLMISSIMLILIVGIIHEWTQGSLNWKN